MQIKTVSYRRVVQPKPFESAQLELTAEVDEGDDINDVVADLRLVVHAWLGLTKHPDIPNQIDDRPS